MAARARSKPDAPAEGTIGTGEAAKVEEEGVAETAEAGAAATPRGTARVAKYAFHRATKSSCQPWGSEGGGWETRTGQNKW